MPNTNALRRYAPWIALALLVIMTAFLLHNQGRLWICACGSVYFWVSDVWSADNSQHIFDAYSFSHLLHGVLFCGMLYFLRKRLSLPWLLVIAIFIEAAWELFENSAFIINRYREATAALGYTGDTVVNSMGDLLSCAIGYFVANRLGLWKSVVLFFLVEIVMIWAIRDSLVLNVIMLIHPIDAIRVWQMG